MTTDATVGGPPRIPGFRYESTLGSGGFADVYRYEQDVLGRSVAIKVLHGLDAEARQNLHTEAHIMARLSSHPAIVPVYQVGESEDGRPYIVMQLCPPPHLSDRIRSGRLNVADVLTAGVQLAGAVETAHRFGIWHRDIKPANILYSEYGRPLLADFGIAHSTGDEHQLRAFTPAFAPPEQLRGAATAQTDVYSLAATLWTALAGVPPTAPTDPGATRPSFERDDVPALLVDTLHTALARDPGDRYQSALGLGRALQQTQHHLGLPVTAIELWDGGDRDTVTSPPPPAPDERTQLLPLDATPDIPRSPEQGAEAAAFVTSGASATTESRSSKSPWPALLLLGAALVVGGAAVVGLLMTLPGLFGPDTPEPAPSTSSATSGAATPQVPPTTTPPATSTSAPAPTLVTPVTPPAGDPSEPIVGGGDWAP